MLRSLDKPILTAVIENIGNATPLTKSSYAHSRISIRVLPIVRPRDKAIYGSKTFLVYRAMIYTAE